MTFKDWDECLKFLDVLTKWPLVVLYLALLFRGAIARKLSGLEKIKVKEIELIFGTLKKVAAKSSPAFFRQFVLKLQLDALLQAEVTSDKPDFNVKEISEATIAEVDEERSDAAKSQEDKASFEEALKEVLGNDLEETS